MAHFRYTIKELKEWSDKELIQRLITERKGDCTNIYAPLYKRLSKLEKSLNEPDGYTVANFSKHDYAPSRFHPIVCNQEGTIYPTLQEAIEVRNMLREENDNPDIHVVEVRRVE